MTEENKVKVDIIEEIQGHINKLEPILDELIQEPAGTRSVRNIIDLSNYILSMHGHIDEKLNPPKNPFRLPDFMRRGFEEELEPEPEDTN